MPIANCSTYYRMLDRAQENKFALSTIYVTSLVASNGEAGAEQYRWSFLYFINILYHLMNKGEETCIGSRIL
jgi:hypothetical protein